MTTGGHLAAPGGAQERDHSSEAKRRHRSGRRGGAPRRLAKGQAQGCQRPFLPERLVAAGVREDDPAAELQVAQQRGARVLDIETLPWERKEKDIAPQWALRQWLVAEEGPHASGLDVAAREEPASWPTGQNAAIGPGRHREQEWPGDADRGGCRRENDVASGQRIVPSRSLRSSRSAEGVGGPPP